MTIAWESIRRYTTAGLLVLAFLAPDARAQSCSQQSPVQEGEVVAVDDNRPYPTTAIYEIDVLTNDLAPSGSTMRVESVGTEATRGTASVSASRTSVIYQRSTSSGQGADSFTYVLSAAGQQRTARVNLIESALSFTYTCTGTGCFFRPQLQDSNNVTALRWIWGDGSPDTTHANPYHQFPDFNVYNVRLVVTYGGPSPRTISTSQSVTPAATPVRLVWRPEHSGLRLFVTGVESNVPANDPGYQADVRWGDGTQTTNVHGPHGGLIGRMADHVYAQPGLYTVEVVVRQGTQSPTTYVFRHDVQIVNEPPVAYFEYSPPTAPGGFYTFFGDGSFAEHLHTRVFRWEFNGEIDPHTGMRCVRQLPPGRQVVRMTVTDDFGDSSTTEQTIDVPNHAPVVRSINWNCTGLQCDFEIEGYSDPDQTEAVNFRWAFGDGKETVSQTRQTTHVFSSYGAFVVQASVNDGLTTGPVRSAQVTLNQPSQGGLHFFAMPPCVVFDSAKSLLASGSVVRVDALTSPCTIPTTAKAIALTTTITSATGAGLLQIHDQPANMPPVSAATFIASTVPQSGNVIAPIDNGAFHLRPTVAAASGGSGGHVGLRLDATGYFAPAEKPSGSVVGPLLYQHLGLPLRHLDTRFTNTPLGVRQPRAVTFRLPFTADPVKASAVMGNLTAIAPTAPGAVAAFSSSMTQLPSSNALAFRGGLTAVATGFVSLLDDAASASFALTSEQPSATTHLAIDAYGYFSEGGPLQYYPLRPCRSVDTRLPFQEETPGSGFPGWRYFRVLGNCGVPANAAAVAGVVTVLNPAAEGWGFVGSDYWTTPQTSTLNFPAGQALANGFVSGFGSVYLSSMADVAIDVYGYFAPSESTSTRSTTDR